MNKIIIIIIIIILILLVIFGIYELLKFLITFGDITNIVKTINSRLFNDCIVCDGKYPQQIKSPCKNDNVIYEQTYHPFSKLILKFNKILNGTKSILNIRTSDLSKIIQDSILLNNDELKDKGEPIKCTLYKLRNHIFATILRFLIKITIGSKSIRFKQVFKLPVKSFDKDDFSVMFTDYNHMPPNTILS